MQLGQGTLVGPIPDEASFAVGPILIGLVFSSVGSILRQSRFRRDPRQMDEDEEMWFNEDEDDFDNSSNADSKMKDCYVALKACPSQQNGPSEKKSAGDDAEKKKSSSTASATTAAAATATAATANPSEAKAVKTVRFLIYEAKLVALHDVAITFKKSTGSSRKPQEPKPGSLLCFLGLSNPRYQLRIL